TLLYVFVFRLIRHPPTPPLFPYTTLFRFTSPPGNTTDRPRAAGTPPADTAGRVAGNDSRSEVTHVRPALPHQRHPLHRPALLVRSEEHTSELQSRENLVCRLLLEKKNK